MKNLLSNGARSSLVLLLGVLPLVVGCGSGSNASETTHPVSRAQFIKEATAICNHGREVALVKSSTYEPPNGRPEAEAAAIAVRRRLLPPLAEAITKVEELPAPAVKKGQLEAFLAAADKAVEKVSRRDAIDIVELEKEFAPSGALARRYGLPACAFGASFK